jgi:predicted Zn finger-like uncharacterized protein
MQHVPRAKRDLYMKFVCDSCRSRYEIADEKVAGKTLQIRCRNCGHVIRLSAPGLQASSAVAAAVESESSVTAWHYSVNGEVFGPYSEDELVDRFRDGRLGDEAYVWQATFAEWKPAVQVPVFASAIAVGRRSQLRQQAPKTMQLDASELGNLMASAQPAQFRDPLAARRATVSHTAIQAEAGQQPGPVRDEPAPLVGGLQTTVSERDSASQPEPQGAAAPVAATPTVFATNTSTSTADSAAPGDAPRPLRRRAMVATPVAFDDLRERLASGNRPATDAPVATSSLLPVEPPAAASSQPVAVTTAAAEAAQTPEPKPILAESTESAPAPPASRQPVDDLPTGELPAAAATIASALAAAEEPLATNLASESSGERAPTTPSVDSAAENASTALDELEELFSARAPSTGSRPRAASASPGLVPPPKPIGARAPSGAQIVVPPSVPRPTAAPLPAQEQQDVVAPVATIVSNADAGEPLAPMVSTVPEPATERSGEADKPAVPLAAQTTTQSADQTPTHTADQTPSHTPSSDASDSLPPSSPDAAKQRVTSADDDPLVAAWLDKSGPPTVTSASYAVPTLPTDAVQQKKKTSPLLWAGAFVVVAVLVGVGVVLSSPVTTISTPTPPAGTVADTAAASVGSAEEASAAAEASAAPAGPVAPTTAEQLGKVRAQRAIGVAVAAAHTAALSSAGLPAEVIAELQRRQQVEQNVRPDNTAVARANGSANVGNTATEGTGQSTASSFANMRNTQQVAISNSQGAQRNDGPGREHFAAGLSGFVANAFRRCVQRHLVDEGSLPNAARVVVEIAVQPDGDVRSIRLEPDLRGTTFGDCMEGNSQNWRFPPFEGALTTLQRTYIIE